jgi:hypothetical protein
MVVAIVVLVALLVGAVVSAVVKMLRAPRRDAPIAEDGRSEAQFRSFWSAALWSAVAVVIGLVLAAATWSWEWALLASVPMAVLCMGNLLWVDERKYAQWYARYQEERALRGLPPRHWWDGRLD